MWHDIHKVIEVVQVFIPIYYYLQWIIHIHINKEIVPHLIPTAHNIQDDFLFFWKRAFTVSKNRDRQNRETRRKIIYVFIYNYPSWLTIRCKPSYSFSFVITHKYTTVTNTHTHTNRSWSINTRRKVKILKCAQ